MNNGFDGGPRGRGRGSWQAVSEGTPRELRRPHAAIQQAAVSASSDQTPSEKPKYTLSAEAKEWYPPNYVAPTRHSNHAPHPVDNYRANPCSGRFSVQNRLQINQAPNSYNLEDMENGLPSEENSTLQESITYLINVMCEVTFCPGKFDVLCGPLVDIFASTLHDEICTRLLVDAIINQSIAEPNFRYNGARLCSMYDSITPEESTFRSCLLERCNAEETKIISGGEPLEENMRGLAMFLAEIYMQLDTQGGRVKSLGESLCKILLYMLDTHETNVKTVCQILKLSGIALDADCPSGMRAVTDRLQRLQAMPLVSNVLALRSNRWGVQDQSLLRQHSDTISNDERGTPTSPNPDDSIYMPDGHALTAEEKNFLETHIIEEKSSVDDEDSLEELESDNWEEGMDPEMQVGFLEFLKMSNQIKR